MKTILSALVALSFVAGVVAPASAAEFSIKTLDQDSRGGTTNGGSAIEQLDKEGRGVTTRKPLVLPLTTKDPLAEMPAGLRSVGATRRFWCRGSR